MKKKAPKANKPKKLTKKEKIEVFDKILNKELKDRKRVCSKCGTSQEPEVIYCPSCGERFKYEPKTFFDWVKAMNDREMQERPIMWTPEFVGIANKRMLSEIGIKNDEFVEHLKNRLKK